MSDRKRIGLREVRALGPGEIVWDSGLPGFAARRQHSDAVSYVLKYRIRSGRQQRWHTIGRHGAPWTPETARAEALRVLGEVAKGADPAGAKAAAKAAPTVTELAVRFLAEHAEAKRKPRTAREYRRLIEKVILPVLGQRRVADVTRQDVARLHHAKRATPTEGNRTLALLSVMFTFAERQGERLDGSNPCRHVERFPQRLRERFLSADELARLGDTLAAYRGSPYHPATIKLLVFTGARLSEVLGLQWDWVSLERGEARLPDSKTGAKTIYLPPPALEVLAGLPRVEGNPYVLGARRSTTFIEKPWRVIREAAGLTDVRLHDLRHAFASVAASAGMGLPIIGKMLGHTQVQTTQRYAHLASDPVKAAAAAVAGKIAAAMKGNAGADNVEPLRPQRA
ncbi:MAG TPA: tyrosine-type recombinase/integrase [Stellaceae bacterium]|nr:tyrosine-type recombinase/integrase [Stellaceae bacterium]